jgi:hypothetical protein
MYTRYGYLSACGWLILNTVTTCASIGLHISRQKKPICRLAQFRSSLLRYKFLDVHYNRIDKERVDTVVILLPDVTSIAPTRNEFEHVQRQLVSRLDQRLGALDAMLVALNEHPAAPQPSSEHSIVDDSLPPPTSTTTLQVLCSTTRVVISPQFRLVSMFVHHCPFCVLFILDACFFPPMHDGRVTSI